VKTALTGSDVSGTAPGRSSTPLIWTMDACVRSPCVLIRVSVKTCAVLDRSQCHLCFILAPTCTIRSSGSACKLSPQRLGPHKQPSTTFRHQVCRSPAAQQSRLLSLLHMPVGHFPPGALPVALVTSGPSRSLLMLVDTKQRFVGRDRPWDEQTRRCLHIAAVQAPRFTDGVLFLVYAQGHPAAVSASM